MTKAYKAMLCALSLAVAVASTCKVSQGASVHDYLRKAGFSAEDVSKVDAGEGEAQVLKTKVPNVYGGLKRSVIEGKSRDALKTYLKGTRKRIEEDFRASLGS